MASFRDLILNSPALEPPPGVVPNLVNPPDLEKPGIAALSIGAVLITLAVSSRTYTKAVIMGKLLLEDYVLLGAFILYIVGYQTTAGMLVDHGFGINQWNVTIRYTLRYRYLLNIAVIIYAVVIAQLKIAIILQYLRVFVPSRNVIFWVLHAGIWLHAAFYIIFTFIEIFLCTHRVKSCGTKTQGKCFDCLTLNGWVAGINMCSDFLLVIIPQFVIWKLRMDIKKKWGLSAVFLIGILAGVCASLRFFYFFEIRRNGDYTYASAMMSIWSVPEITIGFVVMCLPTLPRLLTHLKHKPLVSSISRSLKTGFWARKSTSRGSDGSAGRPAASGEDRFAARKLRANVIVTDIEFHQLVEKTESDSTVDQDSGVHVGQEGRVGRVDSVEEVKAFSGDDVV
jgi:hypothetical protein